MKMVPRKHDPTNKDDSNASVGLKLVDLTLRFPEVDNLLELMQFVEQVAAVCWSCLSQGE